MSKQLRCYYQNTRGLRGKIKFNLKAKFTEANYDCISLTETWLNSNFSSNEIFDGDIYNVYRADRTVENYNVLKINRPNIPQGDDVYGGGCILALKRGISAVRMTDWESETPFDNIWLKLNTTELILKFESPCSRMPPSVKPDSITIFFTPLSSHRMSNSSHL